MRFIKIKNENKLTHSYIQVFTLRHRLNYKKEAEYYDFWSQHLGINGVNEFLMYMPNLNETKRIDGKGRDELLQIFPEDFEATRYVKKSDTEIVARDVKRKCYSPVYPCIGSNGDVVVCCQDPFAKHVMGNIFEASFEEIWLLDKAARMRKMAEEMAFPMCKVCNLRGM
jgi:radical SAM protein with 4Fe4S-binding SPASM domain